MLGEICRFICICLVTFLFTLYSSCICLRQEINIHYLIYTCVWEGERFLLIPCRVQSSSYTTSLKVLQFLSVTNKVLWVELLTPCSPALNLEFFLLQDGFTCLQSWRDQSALLFIYSREEETDSCFSKGY